LVTATPLLKGVAPPAAAVTVSDTVALCEPDAALPVTVSVKVPVVAVEVAEMLKVELAPEVTEVGESVAVTPAGAPVTLSETVCAAPEVVAVLMVDEPAPPCATDTLVGLAAMEKSLAATALMLNVTLVECVADAAVPVTVSA